VLAVLGVVAVAGGAALSQIRRGLFDSDAFADRLASCLGDPRVSGYVAERITAGVLQEKPDLVAVRPVLLFTAHGVVSSEAFRRIVRVTARQAHATALSKTGRNLLLSLPDVDVILRGALAKASPALAARIPPRLSTVIAHVGASPASRIVLDLWQASRYLAWAARSAVVGGLLFLTLGIGLASRRSEALRRAALDLSLAGLFLVLALPVGRAIVSSIPDLPLAQHAAAGAFDAFTRGLRQLALGLAGVGLVFASAAQSLAGRAWIIDTARAAGAWLAHPPPSTAQRLLRGALFLVAGTLTILRPAAAIAILTLAVGAALAFLGLVEVFRLVLRNVPDEGVAEDAGRGDFQARRAVPVLALAGVLALAVGWLGRPTEPVITRVPQGCNGHELLCGRRLDEVVLPGAHNAMSSVDAPNWMFPEQEHGIAGQLDDGVRALLFDVHAAVPVAGRVKTDLGGDAAMVANMEKAVGREGVLAAYRIRERLVGPPEGPRALYLCHGFCELGGVPLVPWLQTLRDFLVANPDEVVVLVIEDYVTPTELAASFAESGLTDLVYRGAPRPPWPTLAEMVASGGRVVTFLESGKPGVEWMHPAFESIQETPYLFRRPSEFSCAIGRGGTAGSLFQINHWIATTPAPKPTNAAIVNAYDFLLARARLCQQERGKLPNIVAVDFYGTGDLFRVVKTLNGLDEMPLPAATPAQP
jgi:hypothetical protein